MPEHVNYFVPATLRAMAAAVPDLEVVEQRTTHLNPVILIQDWFRPRTYVQPEERARLLLRSNSWKASAMLSPLRWGYAFAERVLGTLGLADNCVMVLRRR